MDEQNPTPYEMTPRQHWERAAQDAADFSFSLTVGAGLRFPWLAIDRLVAMPVLPGFLTVIGGRAKAGKSLFMRTLFQAWVSLRKRVLYVGTEQGAHILRMLHACARLQVSAVAAIDPFHPAHLDVLNDVMKLQAGESEYGIIVADQNLTLDGFIRWCGYAIKYDCSAVLLDHFHRMNTGAGADRFGARGDAVQRLKAGADKAGISLVAAGQMKNGMDPLIGEFEVPGSGSWADTQALRREADIALQIWKPLKPGVTQKQKSAARDDPQVLHDIRMHGAMGVRLDAHRYLPLSDASPKTLLRVTPEGELVPWLEVMQGGLDEQEQQG